VSRDPRASRQEEYNKEDKAILAAELARLRDWQSRQVDTMMIGRPVWTSKQLQRVFVSPPRVLLHNESYTEEFRPDRPNIQLDKTKRVARFWWG